MRTAPRDTNSKAMLNNLRLLPNQLTAIRFVSIPVLWVLALLDLPFYVGVGLAVGLVTDAVDGPLARRLDQATAFGSKFDSLADNLLIPSAVVWVLMLMPEVLAEHLFLCLSAVAVYAASIAVGLAKFRRFGNLHLYSSKAAGLVEYIFLIHTFLAGFYYDWLLYAAACMFILSSVETLALQLSRAQVDEHVGSIVLLWLRRRAETPG